MRTVKSIILMIAVLLLMPVVFVDEWLQKRERRKWSKRHAPDNE
jgi:hypothetical protein